MRVEAKIGLEEHDFVNEWYLAASAALKLD